EVGRIEGEREDVEELDVEDPGHELEYRAADQEQQTGPLDGLRHGAGGRPANLLRRAARRPFRPGLTSRPRSGDASSADPPEIRCRVFLPGAVFPKPHPGTHSAMSGRSR